MSFSSKVLKKFVRILIRGIEILASRLWPVTHSFSLTDSSNILRTDSLRAPLGWIEFYYMGEVPKGSVVSIYLDLGSGFNEQERYMIPFSDRGKAIVYLPYTLRALRLDSPKEVKVIGKEVSFVALLLRSWRANNYDLSWLRICLSSFMEGGIIQIIADLFPHSVPFTVSQKVYQREIKGWQAAPPANISDTVLISILMPVYKSNLTWLRAAVVSIVEQTYPHWELCIVDDYSDDSELTKFLSMLTQQESRIRVVSLDQNRGISAATNEALKIANGDYIALVDHDDILASDALMEVVKVIDRDSSAKLIFSDEDRIDGEGERREPYRKGGWNSDLLLSQNLVSHLGVYSTAIAKEIGGFRVGYEGSQDWDFVLRFVEKISSEEIYHIPKVLYHWRDSVNSVSHNLHSKTVAFDAGRQAVVDAIARRGEEGVVSSSNGVCSISFSPAPLSGSRVKVIVFGGDSFDQGLISLECSGWGDLDLEIISEDYLILEEVDRSDLDYLCFLDGRIARLSANWLSEMVGVLSRKGVGAVCGRIETRKGMVINSGYGGYSDDNTVGQFGLSPWEKDRFNRTVTLREVKAPSLGLGVIKGELLRPLGLSVLQLNSSATALRVGQIIKDSGYRTVYQPKVRGII